jgi:simple sugar transport system substrate-binding protein
MTSRFKQFSTFALGALTALGILSAAAIPAAAEGERFVLISHAPDSDSWWNTIKNAIKIASEQMGVTV